MFDEHNTEPARKVLLKSSELELPSTQDWMSRSQPPLCAVLSTNVFDWSVRVPLQSAKRPPPCANTRCQNNDASPQSADGNKRKYSSIDSSIGAMNGTTTAFEWHVLTLPCQERESRWAHQGDVFHWGVEMGQVAFEWRPLTVACAKGNQRWEMSGKSLGTLK